MRRSTHRRQKKKNSTAFLPVMRFLARQILWYGGKKEDTYPRVSNVAKLLLSVPATSMPSERVFSSGGLIASQQRASIKPSNLDAIVFLNRNMESLFGMKALTADVGVAIKKEPGLGEGHDMHSQEEQSDDPPLPDLVGDFAACWEDL